MDWDDLRVFQAVLDTGSLAAGARQLGLTQPTARRRIERLEEVLGATLLTRSSTGILPTEAGRRIARSAEAMASLAAAVERDASHDGREVRGRVRIATSMFMGVEVLPSLLGPLRRRYPDLTIELDANDASVDMMHRDADIAVRMARPKQDGLVARRLHDIDIGFFASTAYLAGRALPQSLQEVVRDFEVVAPDKNPGDLAAFQALSQGLGPPRLAFCSDNHVAQYRAVKEGLGIGGAQVPLAMRQPDLVRILPDAVLSTLEVWLVMHEDLRDDMRIRIVADELAEQLNAYAKSGEGETAR